MKLVLVILFIVQTRDRLSHSPSSGTIVNHRGHSVSEKRIAGQHISRTGQRR